MPYLQIRAHSEILGVRTSTYEFQEPGVGGTHNSTYNILLGVFVGGQDEYQFYKPILIDDKIL